MLSCVVMFCKWGIVVKGVFSSSILFKYESRVAHLFVLSWARVRRVVMGVMFLSDVS